MARININVATIEELVDVPNVGPASALEIVNLREELGALTADDFTTLRCYKKYPMLMESFTFDPIPELRQTSLVLVGNDRSQSVVHDSGTSDFDLRIHQLEEERLKDKELIKDLTDQRKQDQTMFRGEIDGLKQFFQQLMNEDKERYQALKRKTDDERARLEREIQSLKTPSRTRQLPRSDGNTEGEATAVALSYDEKIREVVNDLQRLQKEKETKINALGADGDETMVTSNNYENSVKSGDNETTAETPTPNSRKGAAGGHLHTKARKLPTKPAMRHQEYKEPPPHQRFPSEKRRQDRQRSFMQDDSPKAKTMGGRPYMEGSLGRLVRKVNTMAPEGFYQPPRARNYQPVEYTPGPETLESERLIPNHSEGGQASPGLMAPRLYGGNRSVSRRHTTPDGNRQLPDRRNQDIPRALDGQRSVSSTRGTPEGVGQEPNRRHQNDQARSLPKLPKYSGDGQWKSFYLQFSTYSRLKRWTDEQKITQLIMCLKDKALDFYVFQPLEVRNDFNLTVKKLERRFGKKELPETLRSQFALLKQDTEESLEEWAERVQKLALEAFIGLPEDFVQEEVLWRFCQGCSDKETAQYAADRCPATIEEALRIIKMHIQNSKVIFGSRKTVRQLSCQSCLAREEEKTSSVRSVCAAHSTSCSHSRTSSVSNEDKQVIRKLNSPNLQTSQNVNQRLAKLEDGMEKVLKLLEGRAVQPKKSPKQGSPGSPRGKCYACGEIGHFKSQCPKKGTTKESRSPSPVRSTKESSKVTFADSPLNT